MKRMKQAEHVVLRARFSVLRLKKNKSLISGLLFEGAEKFQVKVYNNSLNSNHIHLLWRRIVHWGRDFLNLHRYIYQNQLETLGLIAYQLRNRKPPPSR
jgi:hypothetical protein